MITLRLIALIAAVLGFVTGLILARSFRRN